MFISSSGIPTPLVLVGSIDPKG